MSNSNALSVKPSEFISDNFQPDDWLAIVIRNRHKNHPELCIATAEQIVMPAFQERLRFENIQGGDIYVSMNPLKPEAQRLTKSDIARIRHLCLDLGLCERPSLNTICHDAKIPKPSYVLNTSEGRYQVIWKVIGQDLGKAEQLQRAMALEYGADIITTDITRLLRLPGFLNHKHHPPYRVTARKLGFLTHTLSEFRIGLHMEPNAEMQTRTLQRQTAKLSVDLS